jgi:hypothetical protein
MLYHGIQDTAQNYETRIQLSALMDLEEQMARFEADYEGMIAQIARYYVLPANSLVLDVFHRHRTIPQLLLEAAPRLREFFGGDAVFNLRVLIDESGSQTLYAVAMWAGRAEDVIVALDHFEDGWWISNSRQASGILTFTYELV